MSERYDCSDPEQREAGIAAAVAAVQKGELVVLPTDTVYGIGADAFTTWAVSRLLVAKGRGRDMPPPVLVGTMRAATALVDDMGAFGQDLIDQFWPGGLTLVCRASPTLAWDLGDTRGTVAVRMPLHAVALDLLKKTGPMAVSSANRTGLPAATTTDEAVEQLGDTVSVYLDGGPCSGGVASTIIDLTGSVPRLLRAGVIPMDRLREVAALVTGEDVPVSTSVNGTASRPCPTTPRRLPRPSRPGSQICRVMPRGRPPMIRPGSLICPTMPRRRPHPAPPRSVICRMIPRRCQSLARPRPPPRQTIPRKRPRPARPRSLICRMIPLRAPPPFRTGPPRRPASLPRTRRTRPANRRGRRIHEAWHLPRKLKWLMMSANPVAAG